MASSKSLPPYTQTVDPIVITVDSKGENRNATGSTEPKSVLHWIIGALIQASLLLVAMSLITLVMPRTAIVTRFTLDGWVFAIGFWETDLPGTLTVEAEKIGEPQSSLALLGIGHIIVAVLITVVFTLRIVKRKTTDGSEPKKRMSLVDKAIWWTMALSVALFALCWWCDYSVLANAIEAEMLGWSRLAFDTGRIPTVMPVLAFFLAVPTIIMVIERKDELAAAREVKSSPVSTSFNMRPMALNGGNNVACPVAAAAPNHDAMADYTPPVNNLTAPRASSEFWVAERSSTLNTVPSGTGKGP